MRVVVPSTLTLQLTAKSLSPMLVCARTCTRLLVCVGCADLMTLDTMTPQERKRQGYIHELIHTEETYVEDLELVLEVRTDMDRKSRRTPGSQFNLFPPLVNQVFYKPMSGSGRLTEEEMGVIFVNWRELIMCNTKLLK